MATTVGDHNEEAILFIAQYKDGAKQLTKVVGVQSPVRKRSNSNLSCCSMCWVCGCLLLGLLMFILPLLIYFCVVKTESSQNEFKFTWSPTSSTTPVPTFSNGLDFTYNFAEDINNCSASQQCSRYMALARRIMNPSADPCRNFYEFACGNFDKVYPLPSDLSWYPRTSVVENTVIKPVIDAIFRNEASSLWPVDNKAKRIYDSCSKSSETAKITINTREIAKITDEFGGLRLRVNETRMATPFGASIVKLTRYNLAALFRLHVEPIKVENYENIIFETKPWLNSKRRKVGENAVFALRLTPPPLSSISRIASLLDQPVLLDFGQRFYAHRLAKVAAASLSEQEQRLLSMNAIYKVVDFERGLARIARSSDVEDDDSNFRWESIADLRSFCNRIDWIQILTAMREAAGLGSDAEINQVAMNNGDRTYLRKLCQYLGEQSLTENGRRAIHNFIALKAVWPHLHAPVKENCVDEAASYLPLVVASLYQRATLTGESIGKVRTMAAALRRSLIDELSESSLLGWKAKHALRNKAKTAEIIIGLPDWAMQEAKLADYYSSFIASDSLIGNEVQLFRFYVRHGILLIKDGAATLESTMPHGRSPLAQNAHYSTMANNIAILPGIINEPFYGDTLPIVVNFAGLGITVGHELAHVFENLDIQTEIDDDMYLKERRNCTSGYFETAFTVDGDLKLRSALTVTDDMAEIGGVGLAYRLYKKHAANHRQPLSYPGMEGLSADKFFFLAYAQSQCTAFTSAGMRQFVAVATHTPNPFRVQGTVSNLPEFAEAYNCPVASPMNPKEKCVMW